MVSVLSHKACRELEQDTGIKGGVDIQHGIEVLRLSVLIFLECWTGSRFRLIPQSDKWLGGLDAVVGYLGHTSKQLLH